MTGQPVRSFTTQEVRNVAVIGHGGAGKTSLVSAMLFVAGAVNRLGKVTAGNTVTDFDPDEAERQISIGTACAHLEWQKNKLNLLDTPGYGAFIGEAKLALRVADGALVVVCGVSGVEVQTEKTWAFADEFGLPRLIVVNRLDRERADFGRALGAIQERFGRAAIPLQIPIGKEKEFRGVIDLLDAKAYAYAADESGKFTAAEVPAELADLARSERERLVEMVAESDDALMERFFDKGELGREELSAGIRRAVLAGKLYPVLAASATANTGTHQILDALAGYLPSPADRGEATGRNPKPEGGNLTRRPSRDDPYAAYVFKTIVDPFAGRITFFRVYSGAIKGDSQVYNVVRSQAEKLGSVHYPQGKDLVAVPEIVAGDIGAVTKLKETKTGDTLADKAHPIQFDAVDLPPSVVTFAIEPKSRGDEEKISTSLQRLAEEDLTLKMGRDQQTSEWILSTTGDLHAEVILGKLKRKFGVEAILHPPRVPYLETIRRKTEAQGRYKKQTGGRGQYGDTWIRMEPLARGAGFEFVNEIFGGSIPKNYIPAVEKGIQEARMHGFLAGYPVTDFRVILFDGSYHTVDSSDLAFKIAGSMGFKKAMEGAGATLLEPIMNVEVALPEESMGDVMGDLNSRRGKVQGVQTQGSTQTIRAQVPMAEMLTYSSSLKSMTGGRGSYQMEFSHYEEVPSHLQARVIEEAKARKAKEAEAD